ncbi:Ribosomal protein S18 acetylase RimI [Micrococcales bacterium KH10]|nr:Ribosomal protein S18 acetylase RimI [Micrococcales bacterium KH10]
MATAIIVRPSDAESCEAIAHLSLEARNESALGAQLCSSDLEQLLRQVQVLSAIPGMKVLVAEHHDQIVGFAFTRVLRNDLLRPSPSVFIEALYVARQARRQGVGRALLAHIADIAIGAEAPDIYVQLLPGARGTQRFLARLGFAPAASHRVVQAAALQRELARVATGRRRSSRTLEDLIARRRRARGDAATGSIDMSQVQQEWDPSGTSAR